jgi:hypothetical protein
MEITVSCPRNLNVEDVDVLDGRAKVEDETEEEADATCFRGAVL